MLNPAPTQVALNEIVRNRWSPRAYAETSVGADILYSLFEAARWAPSCANEQPWAYIVARKEDPEVFARLAGILVEGNGWAKKAPVLALSLAHTRFQKDGSPNRHAFHDVGSASAQLTFEANWRGLLVHQMAGFDEAKAREVFQIPPDWEPVAAMTIGYPGDPETLPERVKQRELAPRTRKPLSEFVLSGSWGHTAPYVVT